MAKLTRPTHVYAEAIRKLKQFTYEQLANEVDVVISDTKLVMVYFLRVGYCSELGENMFKFNPENADRIKLLSRW